MTFKAILTEAEQLSRAEQVQLLDELIRLIGPEAEDVELSPAQGRDLDRRVAEYEGGKSTLVPGDEAFDRLRNRKLSSG